MYKKLTYIGNFIFLVPIIFVIDNSYVTAIGFFGMKAMHGVQYYGIQMFLGLFLIAFIIFILGHVNPKISLWFGEKTRKRSSIIHGIVVGITIVGLIEVNLLALVIYDYEDRIMVSFYEDLKIGNSIDNVKKHSGSLGKHIGYSYSLSTNEKDLISYDEKRNFVDFSYPGGFRSRHLIVETNIYPGHDDARVIGKYLLKNNQLEGSKNEKDA